MEKVSDKNGGNGKNGEMRVLRRRKEGEIGMEIGIRGVNERE